LLLLFVGLFLPYIFGQKNDLERSYELFYQIEVKKESGIRVARGKTPAPLRNLEGRP